MKNLIIVLLLFAGMITNLLGQHQNIMISNASYPEEPSIIIDPKNPARIMAGANIDNLYISADTGKTWTVDKLESAMWGVWGDPCLVVDTNGHFYFFHLSNPPAGSWIDRIVCQKSTDFGQSWNEGSYTWVNQTKEQDKEWAVVDPATNNIYVTWTEFDEYGSHDPMDSSRILFSRSEDGGISWSPAIKINEISGDCIDDDNTTEGAVPAVGPNGEIFVAWAGPAGLVFDRSIDMGQTWLDNDIFIDSMPGGWTYDIPGIYRCNGLPVTVCDISGGDFNGNIYVNWTDQRNGLNDTDVWIAKSVDGGNSWSEPVRVNNDAPGKHQFFTWITVDQSNGNIYIVFYDRRNYSDEQTDVFLAYSIDGGENFENVRISESPFVPISSVFFGDYTNISATNNIVRPIWTRLDGSSLSVWTALIDTDTLGVIIPAKPGKYMPEATINQFPNPFYEHTFFKCKLRYPQKISLRVLDLNGKIVATLVNDELFPTGKHLFKFDPDKYNLESGVYYFQFLSDQRLQSKKIIYSK